MSPAKMAELIDVPCGMWTWVGPRNHVLLGVQIPTHKEAILRAKRGVPRHVQWSIYSKELGRGLH